MFEKRVFKFRCLPLLEIHDVFITFRTHAARVFIIYLQTTRQVPGPTASLFTDIKPNAQRRIPKESYVSSPLYFTFTTLSAENYRSKTKAAVKNIV
jgi:hypothetical protein